MVLIQTKGFEVIGNKQKEDFDKIVNDGLLKIQRKLKTINSLNIHLKEYSKEGRVKYSIHAHVTDSFGTIEADAADWDFNRTLHKVFTKLQSEIEHKFHLNNQNKR